MRIRNWREYQHYDPTKRAAPPWIRLYRKVLDDHEWAELPGDAAKMLVMLWLIASEHEGELPKSKVKLAFRLRMPESSVIKNLKHLTHWIECPASTMLAPCEQDAVLVQSSTEHISTDADHRRTELVAAFDHFWKAYPKKVGKGAAKASWDKNVLVSDIEQIMCALMWQSQCEQWTKDGGQYIPNPATYLNQRRWEDEPVKKRDAFLDGAA